MNCLYINLFFNIVAGIVQTFIKSWNQILYPPSHRSLPALWTTSWLLLAPHHRRRTFSQRDVSLGGETSENRWTRGPNFTAVGPIYPTFNFCVEKSYDGTHLAFGGTLDRHCHFKTRLTQTKPVLPLSNEHGSQVKVQGPRQCCHNKHNKFLCRPTRDVSLLSGHAWYI